MKTFFLLKPRFFSIKNISKKLGKFYMFLFWLTGILILVGLFYGALYLLGKIDKIPILAPLLKWQLLKMISFAFFWMLALSNIITILGLLFTSDDLPLLFVSPITHMKIFFSKYVEALFISSFISITIFIILLFSFASSYHVTYNFIPAILSTIPPLIIIASSISTIIALLIGRFLSVKTFRYIFQLIFLVATIALVFFLRSLEPENLVTSNSISNITAFFSKLAVPTTIYDPTGWIAYTLIAFFTINYARVKFYIFYLYTTAILSFLLMLFLGNKLYFKAYTKQLEFLGNLEKTKLVKRSWIIDKISYLFPFTSRALIRKELILFTRTPVLTTQLLMLGAIVAIYIYNIMLLPLNKSIKMWIDLSKLLGFLNISMASFIVASACLRFVYPTLAIEGKSFYLVRTSPLGIWKFLRTKMIFFSILFIIFASLLILFPLKIFQPGHEIFIISLIDLFSLTIGIVSINLGLGIWFPNSGINSITESPASIGGFMTMLVSSLYIGLVNCFQSVYIFKDSYKFLIGKMNFFLNYEELLFYSLFISVILILSGWIIPLVMAWRKLNRGDGIA